MTCVEMTYNINVLWMQQYIQQRPAIYLERDKFSREGKRDDWKISQRNDSVAHRRTSGVDKHGRQGGDFNRSVMATTRSDSLFFVSFHLFFVALVRRHHDGGDAIATLQYFVRFSYRDNKDPASNNREKIIKSKQAT